MENAQVMTQAIMQVAIEAAKTVVLEMTEAAWPTKK